MAASKSTCQWKIFFFSYSLKYNFRTLANGLGCSPFDIGPSRPMSVCHFKIYSINSFTRFRGAFIHPPQLISALPE